jgi:hypothetical protein
MSPGLPPGARLCHGREWDRSSTTVGWVSVPLHYVVKTRLVEVVEGLGEGAALPPERVLAKEFGVSRWTMRQAIRELIADGRLRARQGQGTFVATPKLVQPLALVSYTEALRAQGHTPAREVMEFDELAADAVLAERLGIAEGSRSTDWSGFCSRTGSRSGSRRRPSRLTASRP